jgi:hypothetical protein
VPETLKFHWYNIIRMSKRLKAQRNVSETKYNLRAKYLPQNYYE